MMSQIYFNFTLMLFLITFVSCDINNITNISSEPPDVSTMAHSDEVCDNNTTTSTDTCMLDSNVTLPSEERNVTDINITSIDNVTSTVTVNITEEITTLLPSTTTTEISTSTDTVVLVEPPPMFDDVCTCDMTMNLCDINCCCDPDCTSGDRAVFSHCDRRISPTRDPRYCYQNLFVYHNNTEYQVEVQHNGMFCIVKDNFPGRFEYLNRKPVTSVQQFKKLYKHNKVFPWSLHISKYEIFSPPKVYKAGQNIWTLVGTTVKPFEIPVSIVNTLCQSSRTVSYLIDQSSFCLRKLSQHLKSSDSYSALNGTYYFQNFKIISAPSLINQKKLSNECKTDVCIPVISYLCSEDIVEDNFSNCSESQTIEPLYYDDNLTIWKNVVHKVHYVFIHNGTKGIQQVTAYIWLMNTKSSQDYIAQRFSISFHWPSEDVKPFRRSGNPGYVIGKPILAGRKVVQVSEFEGNEEKEAIELSENNKYWLTLPKSYNEKCDLQDKQPVTFGEDRRTSCKLKLLISNFTSDQSCFSLQKYILQLLVGPSIENVTEPKGFNVFVSTFGDSKVESTGDWSQVMLENLPTFVVKSSSKVNDWSAVCEGIVRTVQINIAFSYVGSFKHPQAKILGITLKFGEPENLVFDCGPFHCIGVKKDKTNSFELVSSVSFIDVSSPAVPHYAEPPVYEVKLPHDFFYPFISSSILPRPSFVVIITPFVFLFVVLEFELYLLN